MLKMRHKNLIPVLALIFLLFIPYLGGSPVTGKTHLSMLVDASHFMTEESLRPYNEFIEDLEDYGTVKIMYHWSKKKIRDSDVFIIVRPEKVFEEDELDDIVDYVEDGGTLVLIGEAFKLYESQGGASTGVAVKYQNVYLNDVANEFGHVSFRDDVVEGEDTYLDDEVEKLYPEELEIEYYGCTLKIVDEPVVILRVEKAEMGRKDQPVLAVGEEGDGRIIYFGGGDSLRAENYRRSGADDAIEKFLEEPEWPRRLPSTARSVAVGIIAILLLLIFLVMTKWRPLRYIFDAFTDARSIREGIRDTTKFLGIDLGLAAPLVMIIAEGLAWGATNVRDLIWGIIAAGFGYLIFVLIAAAVVATIKTGIEDTKTYFWRFWRVMCYAFVFYIAVALVVSFFGLFGVAIGFIGLVIGTLLLLFYLTRLVKEVGEIDWIIAVVAVLAIIFIQIVLEATLSWLGIRTI